MNYEAVALWSQVVAAVLFAAIVIWGFHKFLSPAINAATATKNEEIRALERRRDDAKQSVEAALTEVGNDEGDAQRIRERIERDGEREAGALVSEAKAEAERLVRNANGELDRARLAARDKLRIELIEKALNLAHRQAAERIDERANQALVRRFIDELERGRAADAERNPRPALRPGDLPTRRGGRKGSRDRTRPARGLGRHPCRRERAALLLRPDFGSRREAEGARCDVLR